MKYSLDYVLVAGFMFGWMLAVPILRRGIRWLDARKKKS